MDLILGRDNGCKMPVNLSPQIWSETFSIPTIIQQDVIIN